MILIPIELLVLFYIIGAYFSYGYFCRLTEPTTTRMGMVGAGAALAWPFWVPILWSIRFFSREEDDKD